MSENLIKINNGMQIFEFDFEENCLRAKVKGIFQGKAGVDILREVPFSDITGIELAKPGFLTVGQIGFIVKNCRYENRPGIDTFLYNSPSKDKYPVLEDVANRIKTCVGNIEIKKKNGFNVPKKIYNGEYDTAEVAIERPDPNKEIRKRCNVCGHIFCYTNADIKKNISNAKSAMWSSVAQIAGGVSGAYAASAVNQTNAQNSLNRIVDYNKCPNCNSNNLSVISDEEFEAMKAQQNVSNQQPVSAADELKKFKELLDMGIITQEEFNAKKKELLGL